MRAGLGRGDRRGLVTRGDAAFAELSAEGEAEPDEPEAGSTGSPSVFNGRPRASSTSRWPTSESSPARKPVAAITASGAIREPSDQQHVGAVEALDAGDELDRAAPDRVHDADVEDGGPVLRENVVRAPTSGQRQPPPREIRDRGLRCAFENRSIQLAGSGSRCRPAAPESRRWRGG